MLRSVQTSIIDFLRPILSISIFFASLILSAAGYYNANFGFKYGPPKLAYTTSAQSNLAGLCSSVVTIKTVKGNNVPTNVLSDLTVTLSGPANVTFYSDSSCTIPITTLTITTGTNSADYYFVATTVGAKLLAADGAGYLQGTQSETLSTNPYVWTGGGGNANWNTAANWSGGSPPGTTNTALFDSTCVTNCSPTINAAIDVGGVRIAAGYAGTITQAAAITTEASSWVQLAGTFAGGSSTIAIQGNFTLVGGTFTSTSNKLTPTRDWIVGPLATFNHASGTISYSIGSSQIISTNTEHYYDVEFLSCGGSRTLTGTMNVDRDILIAGGCGTIMLSGGSIRVARNVSNTFGGAQGTTVITLIGNPAGQTITGAASAFFPSIAIDTGVNNVTLSGTVKMLGSYTVTSVGSLITTGSTLQFSSTATLTTGTAHYNNVSFAGCGGTYSLNGGTLNVDGTLTFSGGCGVDAINSGTIMAYGNVTNTLGGAFGDATVTLAGNAGGQTITGSARNSYFPSIVILAGANPVTLSGSITAYRDFIVSSVGTFTTTGSQLTLDGSGAYTFSAGTGHYNDVLFAGCGGGYDLNGSTVNIDGTLIFGGGCGLAAVNNGILKAYGNVTNPTGGPYGNAELMFAGSVNQTVSLTYTTSGNVTIAQTGGAKVILASNISWNSASQTVSITSGAIDMAGYSLTVKALSLNGNVVTKNAGVLTVNGSVAGTGALFGGTVNP